MTNIEVMECLDDFVIHDNEHDKLHASEPALAPRHDHPTERRLSRIRSEIGDPIRKKDKNGQHHTAVTATVSTGTGSRMDIHPRTLIRPSLIRGSMSSVCPLCRIPTSGGFRPGRVGQEARRTTSCESSLEHCGWTSAGA